MVLLCCPPCLLAALPKQFWERSRGGLMRGDRKTSEQWISVLGGGGSQRMPLARLGTLTLKRPASVTTSPRLSNERTNVRGFGFRARASPSY